MIFGENLPLMLAAAAVGLAIAQTVHPFGMRVPPGVLIVVALLLGLRWVMRRQAKAWRNKLQDVPEHPLGLADDREAEAGNKTERAGV